MKNDQHNKLIKDFAKKSVRQAVFMESCKGMATKDVVRRASMFQGVDVSRFRIVRVQE
jgi:hypothetical protein